jgi:hypothetical protein
VFHAVVRGVRLPPCSSRRCSPQTSSAPATGAGIPLAGSVRVDRDAVVTPRFSTSAPGRRRPRPAAACELHGSA